MNQSLLDERLLTVPPFEEAEPWPTLGPQVCAWIEANLVFGPGDLMGRPATLDAEKRGLVYRMYEIFPQDHPKAGRRRFKRVAVSLRKGSAKTEFAAWIAAAELHPHAPVRCVGWTEAGDPIGSGVVDPYIPMVAYTEEQSEDLAYGALRVILENSEVRDDFDIGLERIMRNDGHGKAVALASAPDSRDGARTTFQHFDETHRFVLPRLKKAHQAMLANIPKRKLSDAWSLETTTAPAPGEDSVAERTMEYARAVADGRKVDSDLFFFHRQAGMGHDLQTVEGLRAAVIEASGPVAEWSDVDGIVAQWNDPTADRAYLQRVWLNQLVRAADKAFDTQLWTERADPGRVVAERSIITLGFDGSRRQDSTALVATDVLTGHQWVVGLWERPVGDAGQGWEVSEGAVNETLDAAMTRWNVWRLYADPPYWETVVDDWCGKYGEERVVKWDTRRPIKMSDAVRAWDNAIKDGGLSQDGSVAFARHVANAYRRTLTLRDEKGEHLWVIQKSQKDSPNKIDVAMAAILSWEARRDAITEGVATQKTKSVYENRGVLTA